MNFRRSAFATISDASTRASRARGCTYHLSWSSHTCCGKESTTSLISLIRSASRLFPSLVCAPQPSRARVLSKATTGSALLTNFRRRGIRGGLATRFRLNFAAPGCESERVPSAARRLRLRRSENGRGGARIGSARRKRDERRADEAQRARDGHALRVRSSVPRVPLGRNAMPDLSERTVRWPRCARTESGRARW